MGRQIYEIISKLWIVRRDGVKKFHAGKNFRKNKNSNGCRKLANSSRRLGICLLVNTIYSFCALWKKSFYPYQLYVSPIFLYTPHLSFDVNIACFTITKPRDVFRCVLLNVFITISTKTSFHKWIKLWQSVWAHLRALFKLI